MDLIPCTLRWGLYCKVTPMTDDLRNYRLWYTILWKRCTYAVSSRETCRCPIYHNWYKSSRDTIHTDLFWTRMREVIPEWTDLNNAAYHSIAIAAMLSTWPRKAHVYAVYVEHNSMLILGDAVGISTGTHLVAALRPSPYCIVSRRRRCGQHTPSCYSTLHF